MVREATISDLPQVVDIFNYYILNTEFALIENTTSVVELLNVYRKTREAGLPFVVICWEDTPQEVLGFVYMVAEMYRVAKFNGLGVQVGFMRPDVRGKGYVELAYFNVIRKLLEMPEFRGYWSESNFGNRHVRHLVSKANVAGRKQSIVLLYGGYKFGKYLDIALDFWDLGLITNIAKLTEHL